MTRGIPFVFFLRKLVQIALVWACAYLAVAFVDSVVIRSSIASVVALTAWWISRDIREMD
jgi:hypothetical protein